MCLFAREESQLGCGRSGKRITAQKKKKIKEIRCDECLKRICTLEPTHRTKCM